MSQRPKRQQKRAKQVRRTNQRAAQREQRPPTPEEITRRMLLQAHELLTEDDSLLNAEMIASDLAAPAWDALFTASAEEQESMPEPELRVLEILSVQRAATDQRVLDTALALALVATSFSPDDEQVARHGAELAEALRGAGATDPSWAGDIGQYEVTEAWQARDPWGTQFDLLIGFRDPSGNEHTLVVMGDEASGHQITDAHVDEPIAALVARMQELIDSESDERQRTLQLFEQLSPARAGGLMHGVVEGTVEAQADELAESDDGLSGCSQIFARYALLKDQLFESLKDEWYSSPFTSALDEGTFDTLHEAFAASTQRAAETDASDEAVRAIADWVFNRGPAHRAVFAPLHVMQFVEEGIPARAEEFDADATRLRAWSNELVAAMRAWARFAASHAPIDDAATDIVVEFIDSQHPQVLLAGSGIDMVLRPTPGTA